jgi:hypothetical protein
MTTMADAVTQRSAHLAKTFTLVVVFWCLAAFLVIALRRIIPTPAIACAALQTLAIVAVALVYMKLATREATIDHALFTGTTWLVLSIVAELAMAEHTGHGWFEIIGSPASGLRNVLMFAWILAPALFASRAE